MLASTLLPLALAGAASMASASPIQYAGRAPSVVDVDGLQREFNQSVERSVAQLSTRSPEKEQDCNTHRSRKVKKALKKYAFTLPLKNARDWEYLASVRVGANQQVVDLMVDTGSADLLLPRVTDKCTQDKGCECHFSSASSAFYWLTLPSQVTIRLARAPTTSSNKRLVSSPVSRDFLRFSSAFN